MKKIIILFITTLSLIGCELDNIIDNNIQECSSYESKCEGNIRHLCNSFSSKWGQGLDCTFYGMICIEWDINKFETRSDCVSE